MNNYFTILKNKEKFIKKDFKKEEELTILFSKNYRNIISDKALFVKLEKKVKSERFKNFKYSIIDGFLLYWDKPTTPSLYITEIELERHSIDKHILPQLGNIISFIQSASKEELNFVRDLLYDEVKKNKQIFNKLQKDVGKEVYELLENSMEDLQILLVIDSMPEQLSKGLSQIEKAINVKIRKIEVSLFTKEKKEIILFSDSDIIEKDEYTFEYHLENKSEEISSIFNLFKKHMKSKKIKVYPRKNYIGFVKNNIMICSCVIRKTRLIFYLKAKINDIKLKNSSLQIRDVSSVGHYTNHLPTQIVITEKKQIEDLINYFDKII